MTRLVFCATVYGKTWCFMKKKILDCVLCKNSTNKWCYSISTGGPKTPPKMRPARKLGLGTKTGPHRRPQNCAGAWASPINEPALPCRPLCGRILSGASGAHGSANLMPEGPLAATPPLSRRFLPLLPFPPPSPAEEPASHRAVAINRGVVGGGETPKKQWQTTGRLGRG
jgi:hypothetical protein